MLAGTPALNGSRAGDFLPIIRANLSREAKFMTDELSSYKTVAEIEELNHESVKHSKKEYVRGEVHTNTVEGYYSKARHERRLSALR